MGRMVLMANMQMERRRVGDCCDNYQLGQGLLMESAPHLECYSNNSSPVVLLPCSFSSGGGRSSGGAGGGDGCIEHTVSKFDTLVGVAIKYGVEVVDIKRMNGLTADQQMFALKSLQIPLRGRHPTSPIMSNGLLTKHEVAHVSDKQSDLSNSIKSLKLSSSCQRTGSPCITSQRYYGCENGIRESFEMTVYREGSARYSQNKHETSQTSEPSLDHFRHKSKILVNGKTEKGDVSVTNHKNDSFGKYFEKLIRRRIGKNTIH